MVAVIGLEQPVAMEDFLPVDMKEAVLMVDPLEVTSIMVLVLSAPEEVNTRVPSSI